MTRRLKARVRKSPGRQSGLSHPSDRSGPAWVSCVWPHDGDPATRGWDRVFQERVPGARGQRHVTIEGAGHFLQEDVGPELARVVAEVIGRL